MLDTSIHCSRKEKPAHTSRKALSGVAVIGALLLTAAVINAVIAVADLRARADSSALAGNLALSVCQTRDHAVLQHPFRGALAPSLTCAAPHG
jgi:hypothetical protein